MKAKLLVVREKELKEVREQRRWGAIFSTLLVSQVYSTCMYI